ncbi:fumarylacetoacetate hydrolase family protein [Mesorhizobium sp. ANAO-SY3R2]|uniref:fumarylacetoacetate hydrolase family protein n=1 Tax=Mesorhizobium sp. ANAO-SY3R2 TaxID=3166644 RepID=UPI00366E4406
MKLATLKNNTRDGQLVLVDRTLVRAAAVADLAPTMQALLDNWSALYPALNERYRLLNDDQLPGAFDFKIESAMAPLPRAYQWCDGSAYLSHAELVRKARNAEMPDFLYSDPLMYQGASDTFIGPFDDIEVADEAWGIDLEAEIAIIVDDVPMGISAAQATQHIKLIALVNDVSLRNLMPRELSKGFGFLQSKPSTAFAAVTVTPDELEQHWNGACLNLKVRTQVNGEILGEPHAAADLNFDFPTLIAHAAGTRRLSAGTIIGSGTISNRNPEAGFACIQERRMTEIIATGAPKTEFLKFGDSVEVEVALPDGSSVFGPIRQRVAKYHAS